MDKFLVGLFAVAFAVGISLLMNYPIMLLYNAILPDIWNLKHITFWQCFGLQLLFMAFVKSNSTSK